MESMVAKGHTAVVHLVGRIASGEERGAVFETTDIDVALAEGIENGQRDYEPVEFRVGAGEVLTGIDEAVREMDVGETTTVRLEPERAFGDHSEDRVVEAPRDDLEARSDATATEGELVKSEAGDIGWITSVADDTVRIDFNHELAGQPVEFEIRVLDAFEPEPV